MPALSGDGARAHLTQRQPGASRSRRLRGRPLRGEGARSRRCLAVSGGAEYYRWLIRLHTGLALTPEEIHKTGLAEIERINRELDGLRQRVGFAGDLAAFRKFLKTDKRFYPATPEEIGNRLMTAVRRIEPKIGTQFGKLPKAPYGVRRLEAELEGAMTFGYYRQPTPAIAEGDYYYNGSRLSGVRSECRGAHLSRARSAITSRSTCRWKTKPAGLPAAVLRRNRVHRRLGEYASALAARWVYADPYDACGRLAMDAFHLDAPRRRHGYEQLSAGRASARVAYMKANTFGDLQIGTESLRYSTDIPARRSPTSSGASRSGGCGRRNPRSAPGTIPRRFHDAVLGSGTIPLSVLGLRSTTSSPRRVSVDDCRKPGHVLGPRRAISLSALGSVDSPRNFPDDDSKMIPSHHSSPDGSAYGESARGVQAGFGSLAGTGPPFRVIR